MKKTFVYFQPEYVSKFQCNGKACSAQCCRKSWVIDFDKKTYKKISHIKPKSKVEDFLKRFSYDEKIDKYLLTVRPCPMLTEENLCGLQLEFGEEFLSETCVSYPRITKTIGDIFERSLSLTCPVAATQILMATEPLAFEYKEVSRKVHDGLGKIKSVSPPPHILPLINHIVEIQVAAISILQARNLTIDQRLIVLGFFLDKLDELIKAENFSEIENLSAFYSADEFLQGDAINLTQNIQFNAQEHMRLMLETFEALYGGDSIFLAEDQKLVDVFSEIFHLTQQNSVGKIAQTYTDLAPVREMLLRVFPAVFENYLVNDFFLNLYPFKGSASITDTYGVFLTTYKMIELLATSFAVSNFKKDPTKRPPLSIIELSAIISLYCNRFDHSQQFMNKIYLNLKDKYDMMTLMQNFLQS